ncbi:hypothetical protein BO83DRAFT_402862 [Aspergillus eucalypticola CBS 122712]|uniref:Uncharacterized protein n=1 Tax=Aspergillus eucalypticola (strain CBS 122712 / IBT 29274) TaxID=1448314 RepID=A0A317UQV8_ASPEC|nr:uncharacterized protein BO83DRAFT_402862 [Aspergillus eucalypticola CBS 122712]PWY63749.1 hypothetical protein BO83DRAFT_402862 [Aspergillus eucalypticola CBS 122712]
MDTRGEKVHKRMVICGSCGRLEEEKEEKRPCKTSLERKGVSSPRSREVESLRGAEVLSERLQFDVKKGAWRGEGPNSGPRDQDYRGVFSPRRNQPDASDEPITGPVSGAKKKKRSTGEHRQACAQGYTYQSPCASSTPSNRDMSLPWNHGSFTCSPKIEGKRNQDMTRINANEGARANSHCPGAMLAAIVRCSRLSGEYLRSDGVWGVMTVGDPIVHNWRTEDPNTSRRPIMLQVENHLIVPIALRIEQSQQYAKNWPFEGKLPIRAFMVQVDLGLNRTRARNYCRVDLNPAGSSWVCAGYRHKFVDHAHGVDPHIFFRVDLLSYSLVKNSAGRILLKFGFLPLQKPPYPRVSRSLTTVSGLSKIALILRYGIYRGVI